MQLILTHENADFDAVASQLAAHKLYPEGTPLLSWRVNRNVQQFLALYWDALDFVRSDEWKRQRIERIILVDTGSLPSVRGVRADRVDVMVIDHHEISGEANREWRYHIEPVGATTTILVDLLRDAGLQLNINEATLLLLGIHEDTGSMVYDTTTARDVRAAAWLMEQGARMSVVRRFLNIQLSEAQQHLYEQLQSSVEWIRVEGLNIAISAVRAPADFDDEISAVAHRLRDTLTPDGLFILVQLKHNHVQLVARSGTDQIDVSIVARSLGGGGHSRAAAATVMDRNLEDVYGAVRESVMASARPMAKVADIMSFGVQTIQSDALVRDAAELMRRSGHEGYPVVDSDSKELVGLLTRRIVDRAVSHKLQDLPVGQVMRAGSFTVRPSDPVEQVQRLMIEEGWGQIPVEAESNDVNGGPQLLGIVTRTDMINLLSNRSQVSREPDMRSLMARTLPQALWVLIQVVSEVADEMDTPVYFVGGLVRDLLLSKSPVDIDMVVEGDAIALVKRLQRTYGGERRSHEQFGTAKWLLSNNIWARVAPDSPLSDLPNEIDFVTARTEFYTRPTALPEVERGSIKLDLHRRDFTINTLAVRLDGAHLGELLDFYNGQRDLELGVIRVLHSLSFIDDPTRILRAIRLEQRLDFRIERRTAELIASGLPMLDRVTGDRIRNELELCLTEVKNVAIMRRLNELGVFTQINKDLGWHAQSEAAFKRVKANNGAKNGLTVPVGNSPAFFYFALWLVPQPIDVQKAVMKRLRVRKTTRDDLLETSGLLASVIRLRASARPSEVVKMLRPYRERVLLASYLALDPSDWASELIAQYLEKWRHIKTSVTGLDLLELGLKPGPRVGRLLERLLAARIDGEVNSEQEERQLLNELLVEDH